jgi:hypothetical protein
MKIKYTIIFLLHLVLVIYILVNQNLLVKDIIEFYLFVFLMSFVFSGIIYLLKKKPPYINYIQKELFKTSISLIGIFGLIIFSTQTRYIQKNNAIGDLDYMVEKFENIHPDLYHNVPKDSFSLILNETKKNLPDKISELEFYKVCSRLTSLFKDGHTHATPNILNNRMQLAIRAIFPCKIRIINEKIYVIDNLVLFGKIPVGSEIVGINGKSPSQFINEMSQLISYENVAWRNKQISDPFTIGIWNNYKSYGIMYKKPGSDKISRVKSSGGFFSKMYIFYLFKMERPEELVFKMLPGNTGYIGFYGCNDLKGFTGFYERTFKKIKEKNIKNLVIDIRSNGGGHSVIGAELMQYLFHKPFKENDSITFKISKDIAETGKMDYYLKPEERVIGKMFTNETTEPYYPRDNPIRFSGRSFLLTDNGTFSAATMFASSYKCFGEGTIIGEETGGVTVGFGDVHFFDLPDSKMKMMVSWKKFYNVCGIDNQRGVMPDFIVSNTIEDDMLKKDRVFEYAMDLIRKE